MVRVPWKHASMGARTPVRVELVDLYRTLVDLAGLDSRTVQPDVQGTSLAPLFDSPATPPPALTNNSAFSQIGSCNCTTYTHGEWTGLECNAGRCAAVAVSMFDFMGYTMRTPDGFRYTLWAPMDNVTLRVNFNGTLYDELYNQTADDGTDFDLDSYAFNIAKELPTLVSTLRAELISAVLSWY